MKPRSLNAPNSSHETGRPANTAASNIEPLLLSGISACRTPLLM